MYAIVIYILRSPHHAPLIGPTADPTVTEGMFLTDEGISYSDDALTQDRWGFLYCDGRPLFTLDTIKGEMLLRPVFPDGSPVQNLIGGMMSGAYGEATDARFPSSNALRIHDRYETREQYRILSA